MEKERKKLINWLGLAGVLSLLSYAAAVIFSPLDFPGYKWMEQAVSDLSAVSAPSKLLWERLSAPYGACGVICMTAVSVYISERKTGTKLFRLGIYLFAIMSMISNVGYKMFPLVDAGKEIKSFQEVMHIVVTVLVVLLSIVSLILLIIAGCKEKKLRPVGIFAAIALGMMFVGSVGTAAVPPEYFGIVERFSVFAAEGFKAFLGCCLFLGFRNVA